MKAPPIKKQRMDWYK